MKKYCESELLDVQAKHGQWFASQPGVIGTSVSLGKSGNLVLRVYTSGISNATRQAIQSKLSDVPVEWDEGDEIIAY
jgi:hypothetical protein